MISSKDNGNFSPKLAAKLEQYAPVTPRAERPVARTSAGLRNALFDEIDALRRGEGDPQRATAVAKLAQNILAAAKMEYQLQQKGIAKPQPLLLGDDSDEIEEGG